MSFDTPTGTRGRRQPGGWARWLNKLTARRIGRKGKVMGFNALVLTTIGRKSGVERQSPVGWFPGPDDSWLIVAAAAGAAGNPAWYYNLAAHPDQVWIEMGGRKVAVTAGASGYRRNRMALVNLGATTPVLPRPLTRATCLGSANQDAALLSPRDLLPGIAGILHRRSAPAHACPRAAQPGRRANPRTIDALRLCSPADSKRSRLGRRPDSHVLHTAATTGQSRSLTRARLPATWTGVKAGDQKPDAGPEASVHLVPATGSRVTVGG